MNNNKATSGRHGQRSRNGYMLLLGLMVALACVLVLAVRIVLAAPTYAGPISVTANMGSFSPSLVQVNSPATASLSAYYTPPSGVPEGQLSASYDWSVSQVQYKALQADTFGSPPANSYTASISPAQPSASSGATLTFTPLIAGYWQVSTSCSVTVTDVTTNQYWTGSSNAGPEDETSWTLSIGVGTPVVTGGINLNVCVGEQIPLTASYGPGDMALQWTVPGSIIAGYSTVNSGPKTTNIDYSKPSTAAVTPVTAANLTQPLLTFYWMDTDSGSTENEQVSLSGTLSGDQVLASPVTFNVYRPSPTYTASYPDPITLIYYGQIPILYLADGSNEGIQFNFSVPASPFGGTTDLNTVQTVTIVTETTEQYNSNNNTTTNFGFSVPSTQLPAPILDTVFPYGLLSFAYNSDGLLAYEYTSDAPSLPIDPPITGSGFGPGAWSTVNVAISEAFIHDLLFMPAVSPNPIWAPLSKMDWGWTAQADNGKLGFSLVSSAKVPSTPPESSDLSALPVWNSNIGETISGGGEDPDWSPVP